MKKKIGRKGLAKSMTFSQILSKHPESAEILMEKGMHCIGCSMAAGETLEQGALMHGINPDDLIDELNSKLNKKQIIKSKKKIKRKK